MNTGRRCRRALAGDASILTRLALNPHFTWLTLLLVLTGIASSAFRVPYGGPVSGTISRLGVTACVLFLMWRLRWLRTSGLARRGRWSVWVLAFAGMIYIAGASLYSLCGRLVFDVTSLWQLPASRAALVTVAVVALSEEILFRGLALYALVRVWGNTTRGILGSVALTSLVFAALHIMQAFTHAVSLPSVLLLTLQTCIIAIWWAALVVTGGSIWPAVMLHFVVNAVAAIQGLTVPMVDSPAQAYLRLFWFSIPLGVLGVGMIMSRGLDHAK